MHINCVPFLLLATLLTLTPVHCQEAPVLNIEAIDLNSDGEITLDEFRGFVLELPNLRDHYSQAEIDELSQAAFQMFDHDKNQKLER
jgi:Ca2+-binding EF-hand superfamily protein